MIDPPPLPCHPGVWLQVQTGNSSESTVAMLPTVRVNQKQYRGQLEAASVLRALCSRWGPATWLAGAAAWQAARCLPHGCSHTLLPPGRRAMCLPPAPQLPKRALPLNPKSMSPPHPTAPAARRLPRSFPVGSEPSVCNERWVSDNECAAGSEGDKACNSAPNTAAGRTRCVNTFAGARAAPRHHPAVACCCSCCASPRRAVPCSCHC
jgi:hypothetical protein